MINFSCELKLLKHGEDLLKSFHSALNKTFIALMDHSCVQKKTRMRYENFIRRFSRLNVDVSNVGYVVDSWCTFSGLPEAQIKSSKILLECAFPELDNYYGDTSAKWARNPLKVFFMLLHAERAVLLPYSFVRPIGEWVDNVGAVHGFYSECFQVFRTMDVNGEHKTQTKEYGDDKTLARICQTAAKIFLSSTWYEPEDINSPELQAWREFQTAAMENGKAGIPLLEILDILNDSFEGRLALDVKKWAQDVKSGAARVAKFTDTKIILRDALAVTIEPLEVIRNVLKITCVGSASFSVQEIGKFEVVEALRSLGIDIGSAFENWKTAEEFFFEYKSGLESSKPYRTAIGRLNLYVLLYLPLWIHANPNTGYKYPSAPNLFKASVHYNCTLPLNIGRPLSFLEFFRELDFVESYENLHKIFMLFKVLIDVGPDLPGCEGLKQPVLKLPASFKYASVTKNIFPGDQLLLYVDFLYAIEYASEFLHFNSTKLSKLVETAKNEGKMVSFSDIGYVPIVYRESAIVPVMDVHPDIFVFAEIDLEVFYNPGSIRFSLFLLEVGTRGQTAQWLDARSYDRVSDRISTNPLQLTCLWLNTDKVSSSPLVIVSIMQALWLLDSQREWRNRMIVKGAKGFTQEVYYEGKSHSKWGKILPLFAADPITGQPFIDAVYARFWTAQCYSFQCWMKKNEIDDAQLVALLPKSNDPQKQFFDWDDWLQGIDESKVLVVSRNVPKSSWALTTYLGDYCPVNLRAKVTPHGARASFITSMSTVLSPETIVMLTGQKEHSVRQYSKGQHLLRRNIQGAFNNRDASLCLTNPFEGLPSISDISTSLEALRDHENFEAIAASRGLFSIAADANAGIKKNGLQIIASDRSRAIGVEYTHMCACGFQCPLEVVKEYGERNCTRCPYAIFSASNIAAVAAKRQQLAEEYLQMVSLVKQYVDNNAITKKEMVVYEQRLNKAAKEAVGWMVVEESLWAMINECKKADVPTPKYLSADTVKLFQQIERFEVKPSSSEGFFLRLAETCFYEQSMSQYFRIKIDRAVRRLLVQNEGVIAALTMPAGYSSSVKLAGMIRSGLEFDNLNIDEFVKYINMDEKQWIAALIDEAPDSQGFLLENDIPNA